MPIEYDDFYGDQSSESAANSDDGDGDGSFDDGCNLNLNTTPSDPFGNVADHEFRSRESSVQTLSYLDGYDETKEIKLQEGFSDGYRKSFHDAFRIGRCLGSSCAKAAKDELLAPGEDKTNNDSAGNTDQKATTKAHDPAILVRRFLREEVLIGSNDKGNDMKYDDALLQLEQELGRISF